MNQNWSKFPYEYKPKRNLKVKEISQLLEHLFSLKVFPQEFYDTLPENLKEHFSERNNPEEPPMTVKRNNSAKPDKDPAAKF